MKVEWDKVKDIVITLFKEFKPKPRTDVLEFAKEHGYLSSENSAIVGRFVPFPYQEEPMRNMSNPKYKLMVFLKSTRVGYTRMMTYAIGYNISEDPCPQWIMLPTDPKANEFSKKELKPLLRDCARIGERIYKDKESNNLNFKAYPNGYIQVLGGQTPNNYASATIKKIYLDEYDRFPDDIGGEGDPYKLVSKRTESFYDGCVFIGSTPTDESSKTFIMFNSTDMRYRYYPCPKCGFEQQLDFKQLVWEKAEQQGVIVHLTNTAKFKCLSCGDLIEHKHKRKMDTLAQWRQTQVFYCCGEWQKPVDEKNWNDDGLAICKCCKKPADYNNAERLKIGYFINSMMSHQPSTTWVNIAEEFVAAKGNESLMKTFKNTWLAEIFEGKKIEINWHELMEQRETYTLIPEDVLVLTMAVDTQGDRLEWSIRGWSKGETSYGLDKGIINGDPNLKSTWEKLYEVYEKVYTRDGDGVEFQPYWVFIDSGGNRTEYVYDFVARDECQGTFWAIKGLGANSKNAQNDNKEYVKLSNNGDVRVPLMLIETIRCKDLLYERLQKKPDEVGALHFNMRFDNEYFEQVTSEKKVFTKNAKGYLVEEYHKQRERNEAADLETYHIACIKMMQKQDLLDLSI
jgi:phage terminase large subunit GpA-like protein